MKREINWSYFSRLACPGCTEVRRAGGSDPCEVHEEMGALFVQGFEQAARLAVGVTRGWPDGLWRATAPGGWHLVGGVWAKTLRSGFLSKEGAERSLVAALPLVWWPVQPWEVEVSDDAVR